MAWTKATLTTSLMALTVMSPGNTACLTTCGCASPSRYYHHIDHPHSPLCRLMLLYLIKKRESEFSGQVCSGIFLFHSFLLISLTPPPPSLSLRSPMCGRCICSRTGISSQLVTVSMLRKIAESNRRKPNRSLLHHEWPKL